MFRTQLLLLLAFVCLCAQGRKPLHGVHLRVLPMEAPEVLKLIRSANGTLIGATGRLYHILEWLADSLGFTYTIIDINYSPSFLNTSTKRGAMEFLMKREVDFALGAIYMVDGRFDYVDLTFPYSVTSFSLLTPIVNSVHLGAPWLPFQYRIWILILVSILLLSTILCGIGILMKKSDTFAKSILDDYFGQLDKAADYLILVILSQGGVCYPKKLAIRLIAGVWCISCFVLVNSYCSTLVSFLTASTQQPLLNSIYDLPNKPGVHVVVDEGVGTETVFKRAESGILKYVGQDLIRNPYLRCRHTSDCINRVKSGGHVYVNTASFLMYYMNEDFKVSGKCSLAIGKESFITALGAFALTARNPATKSIDDGIIRLWETGLLGLWRKWYLDVPKQCLIIKRSTQKNEQLTLKSLESAFILLFVGYGTAFISYISELIFKRNLRPFFK